MLTSEERLLIGLKVLERLKPSLRARRAQRDLPLLADAGAADASAYVPGEVNNPIQPFSLPQGSPLSGGALPGGILPLSQLLDSTGPLAPGCVVLGACEDGLPFLLDLDNPEPGSLLVAGDRGCGKTRLLQAVLTSAVVLNSPEEVAYSILAYDPFEYAGAARMVHCQELAAVDDPLQSDVIAALTDLATQRRHGDWRGPAMLLVIDDLATCLQYLDDQSFAHLYWLVRHGPQLRIWTLASLASETIDQVDERLLAAFPTRLLGSVHSSRMATYLARDPHSLAGDLVSGSQFCVPFAGEWIRFWVCDPS